MKEYSPLKNPYNITTDSDARNKLKKFTSLLTQIKIVDAKKPQKHDFRDFSAHADRDELVQWLNKWTK